jgi:hypothetical protein
MMQKLDVLLIVESRIIRTADRLDVVRVEWKRLGCQWLTTVRAEGLAIAYTLAIDSQAEPLPLTAVSSHGEAFASSGGLALARQPTAPPANLGFQSLTFWNWVK